MGPAIAGSAALSRAAGRLNAWPPDATQLRRVFRMIT
jgi:hypothetical protein